MTTYLAGPTANRFHKSNDFVRAIMGPFGSGKSVACCFDIFMRALKMPPDKEGYRRSRWVVARESYRMLLDTTLRTWFDWFPAELGYFNKQDMRFVLTFGPGDGTVVELEILFRSLARPDDIGKLLSLELTGAWINEAKEVPRAILDLLGGRVGRFPSRRHVKDYWYGIIMDTNPPDSDHWFYKLFEEQRPENFSVYKQPSGLSAKAENKDNLPPTYYTNMVHGKTKEWIKVFVEGQYGFVSDGKPVFEGFNDDVHVSSDELRLDTNEIVYVGIDFGLTPAAVICQSVKGQWRVLDEIVTESMGQVNFAPILGKKLKEEYHGCNLAMFGDPAGSARAQSDETTPFEILANFGLNVSPTHTNDWDLRVESVTQKLNTMVFGQPALLISPKAVKLRKGMNGGYKLRRLQVVGEDRYVDTPDKSSIYSHVCDALQYAILGSGEAFEVLGYTKDWDKSINRPN